MRTVNLIGSLVFFSGTAMAGNIRCNLEGNYGVEITDRGQSYHVSVFHSETEPANEPAMEVDVLKSEAFVSPKDPILFFGRPQSSKILLVDLQRHDTVHARWGEWTTYELKVTLAGTPFVERKFSFNRQFCHAEMADAVPAKFEAQGKSRSYAYPDFDAMDREAVGGMTSAANHHCAGAVEVGPRSLEYVSRHILAKSIFRCP